MAHQKNLVPLPGAAALSSPLSSSSTVTFRASTAGTRRQHSVRAAFIFVSGVWTVTGEKVVTDLLSLPHSGLLYRRKLAENHTCAVQYLFATVCQISGTCANFSNQAKENSKAKIALYQNVKSQQLKIKV